MRRIAKSSAFRIALAFAVALTTTTYAVFALVGLQFHRSYLAHTRTVLADEVRGTLDTPTDRLEALLRLRLTQDVRHLDYVGLFQPDGRQVLGNVHGDLLLPHDGRTHLITLPSPRPETTQDAEAIVVATNRPDGSVLILGRSLADAAELTNAMLHAFVAAIVPVVLLALAVGTIVSVRASRRLTVIQEAIQRVMGGELHVRLPARGTPDDVDELVRAVNSMLDEIVRLLNQIKSVGDNIAHDLRAPLAVMRARLERGLAASSEAEMRRLANEALTDLERAMTTVTALLRISELESGLRRASFDKVDLRLVARDAFELYAPFAEAKGVAMSLAADAPLTVFGDGDLLREALVNLVDNAVKFTPRGGAVHVACGEPGALLSVADTGPGVAEVERDKITKRFYRAAATREAPGQGLGLSMAMTILELHGFALKIIDNRPGAVFEVVREETTHNASAEAARPRIGGGLKGNLVDRILRTT